MKPTVTLDQMKGRISYLRDQVESIQANAIALEENQTEGCAKALDATLGLVNDLIDWIGRHGIGDQHDN